MMTIYNARNVISQLNKMLTCIKKANLYNSIKVSSACYRIAWSKVGNNVLVRLVYEKQKTYKSICWEDESYRILKSSITSIITFFTAIKVLIYVLNRFKWLQDLFFYFSILFIRSWQGNCNRFQVLCAHY